MANQKFLLILHRLVKECKKDSCSSPAVALVAAGFCNFKTIIMKLSNLKPNEGQIEGVPSNPRTITEDDFDKLKKSLVNFRKMLSLRPMVVDEDWNILGGNMRYQALCRLRDEGVMISSYLTGLFKTDESLRNEFMHIVSSDAKI